MSKSRLNSLPFFCLFLILISFSGTVQAQDGNNQFWQRVRFGGGIGLSFGNGFFSGTLAPSAIYEFDDKLATGVGLSATYTSERDFYNATVLGGSVLALYNVIPEIQLSAEYEQLNVNRRFESVLFGDENFWSPAFFVGAGYRAQIVTIGIRYNLLFDEDDGIYANAWMPFVRVFF